MPLGHCTEVELERSRRKEKKAIFRASWTHGIQLLNLLQLGKTDQGFCASCVLLGFLKESTFKRIQNQQEKFEAFS